MHATSESWATTMATGPCIVDLSDEDDDEDVVFLSEFPAHLAHRASRKPQSDIIPAVLNSELVILEDVDINPELNLRARLHKDSQKSSQNSNTLLDEDDCCILDEDPSKVDMVKAGCAGNDSDDLVMTGEVGQVACRDFPHARHLCVQFPFRTTPHNLFCIQCHCYVCDRLAPCSLWGDGTRGGDHCHASDKIGERWKLLRQYNKTHPTGCSDPSALQHLLYPGKSSAGKSDSGAQRFSYPAGYEHLLVQSKAFVTQFFSDLFSPDRESRVSKFFGAFASTSSTRGFSLSPPVTTGNSESSTLRELLGCQLGDSARPQHPQRDDSTRSQHPLQRCDPTRPKYPLQISLNRSNHGPGSHPRRHHTQGLGVRAAKFHGYVHRNDPHYSNTYRSYQPEGVGGYQPRRTSQKNGPFSPHDPPHPCSIPGSIQRSHSVFSPVLPRRSTPIDTTVGRESFGGLVLNGETGAKNDYRGDLAVAQAFLASCSPDRPEDLRQQCLSTETPSAPSFGSSDLLGQNEIDTYNSHGDERVESCNAILVDTQFSGGSFIQRMAEGNMDSLPTSPPTLLVDYLLNGDDFWND